MPPLTILRGISKKKWSTVDRLLAVAHVMAQDLLCPGCGQPKNEAFNPDSEGYYEVRDTVCNGCLAASRDADLHKEHTPERKIWIVDERPPEVQLKPWNPN